MIKFIKTNDGFYYNNGKRWTSADGRKHHCSDIEEFDDYYLVHEDDGIIKVRRNDVVVCKYDDDDNRGNR